MRKLIVLGATLLLAPAVSQAKTLEDLLVEKGVITKGEASSAKGGVGQVSYSKKGTRFDFPQEGFTTAMNVYLQEAYTFTDQDEDSGKENTSSFDVTKARVYLHGTALNEEFSYMLNGDFVGDTVDGEDTAALKDAFLKWNACDDGWVRIGQFKTGLSRQFNNSSSKLMFARRSITSDFFDLDRQGGADTSWNFAEGQFVVGAGIFNGSSDGEGVNRGGVDTKHTGVATARFNALGKIDSFSESDVDWTEDAALSFGAAYAYSDATNDVGGLDTEVDGSSISVDANFKYLGWGMNAEYFYNTTDVDNADADIEPSGFYAQVGYFIDPKTVELALGYSLLDCDNGAAASGVCEGNDKVNEAKVGINYYWWGHNLKAQLNYVFQNEDTIGDGDDINTNKWILQFTQVL